MYMYMFLTVDVYSWYTYVHIVYIAQRMLGGE